MVTRRLLSGIAGPHAGKARRGWTCVLLLLVLGLAPAEVLAQRPFRISDPFYRNETARRDFYDHYAVTGEIAYRSSGAFQDDGLLSSSDLALRLRVDYELATRLDAGAIFEAIGVSGARKISLSWILLRYYRYLDHANYSFRLAVDPASDGRSGFPQVDLAFIYTSLLSPILSSDFAVGVRRVNLGYMQPLPLQFPQGGPYLLKPQTGAIFTRALGSELHVMMNYNLHFDPAGSNLFIALLGEGGQYELVETQLSEAEARDALDDRDLPDSEASDNTRTTPYRGGVVWMRSGIELRRPSHQVSPFIGLPLQQWHPDEGDWPRARLQFGIQLMLR